MYRSVPSAMLMHNSLAESINGSFKTELIKPPATWWIANHIEAETAAYLDWFNNRPLV